MSDSRAMLSVPRAALDRLERDFFHMRFMASRVATELDKGGNARPLANLLREEADRSLQALTQWREARSQAEHHQARLF